MAEPAADVGPHLALLAEEDIYAPVLDRDAAGAKAGIGVRLKGFGKGLAPAERCDVHAGSPESGGTALRAPAGRLSGEMVLEAES